MGQLAYGAVGAVIGYYVGGPQGAQYGWAIGSAVGGVIDPPKLPDGPRLSDLTVQISSYGESIPRRFGTVRLTGNVIWATPLLETESEDSGKGGSTQTNFQYSCSFAVALCEGPITGVSRIWADGKLIYDIRPENTGPAVGFTALGFKVYPGDESQDVDPTIQAYMTHTPAYRGLAYVVFTDLQLARYGNRIPNLSFEVCDGVYSLADPIQWGERYDSEGDADLFQGDMASDGSLYISTKNGHYYPPTWSGEPPENGLFFDLAGIPQIHRYDSATRRIISSTDVKSAEEYSGAEDAFSEYSIDGHGVCFGDRYYIGRGQPGKPPGSSTFCESDPLFSPVWKQANPYIHGYSIGPSGALLPFLDISSTAQFNNLSYWPGVPIITSPGDELVYWLSTNGLKVGFGVGFTLAGIQKRTGDDSCGETTVVYSPAPNYTSITALPFPQAVINADGKGWVLCNTIGSGWRLQSLGVGAETFTLNTALTTAPAACFDKTRGVIWSFAGDGLDELYSYGTPTGFTLENVKAVTVDTATGHLRVLRGTSGLSEKYLTLFDPINGETVEEITVPYGALPLEGVNGRMRDLPLQRAVVFWNGYRIWTIPYGASLAPDPVRLHEIVTALSLSTGVLTESDIDVTELTDLVWGYTISRQGSTRTAIEQLMLAFLFDAVESEGKIKFVKRGKAPVRDIDPDDIAVHEISQERPIPLELTRAEESELPKVISLKFVNQEADYQVGAQEARRQTGRANGEITLDVPVAMLDIQAKAIVDNALYSTWVARTRATWTTTLKHADLEPTDVIRIDGNIIRIRQRALNGNILRFDGEFDSGVILTAGAVAGSGAPYPAPPPTITDLTKTELLLLDIPLLSDADDGAGFYAAALGVNTPWPGATLNISSDGGSTYSSIDSMPVAVVRGAAVTVLADNSVNLFDEANTVTVTASGPLASAAELAVLNGANIAILGDEIIQFKRATANLDGSYTLGGLLRGRKGSPTKGHIIGERFVLVGSAVRRIPRVAAEIGLSRIYKAPTLGATLESADPVFFTNAARGLQPLAGVQLGAGRATDGAIRVTWVRRTRIDGGWRDNVDVALGETAEQYVVNVYSGAGFATVVYTETVSTTVFTLSAAQQTTIFGGLQSSLFVRIYQQSSTVGAGQPLQGII